MSVCIGACQIGDCSFHAALQSSLSPLLSDGL
jgi:hypothetical protein